MSETNNPEAGAEKVREGAAQVGEGVRNMGQQAKQMAQEKYQDLREQASEYYEAGRERAHQLEQTLEEYVQEKPLTALLIAAGAGFLLGAIWKRS